MSIQSWSFERASLRKPCQTLGQEKLSCSFVFCFLLSEKLMFIKAYSWKLLGQSFLQVYGILLRGLTSICPSKVDLLNVHPREKPFQTVGTKNCPVLLFFVFCCQENYWLWRLTYGNSWASLFYRHTLEGSNGLTSICPSKVRFFERASLRKPFQTPGAKKHILFFRVLLAFVVTCRDWSADLTCFFWPC